MRQLGIAVFIYSFMNAYYGVGSSKNAFMLNMSSGLLTWLLASAYALFWMLYLIGGIGLILKKAGFGRMIMAASCGSALILLLSFLIFPLSDDVPLQYALFQYARPVPDIFLFVISLLLFRTVNGLPEPAADRRMISTVMIVIAAVVPWIARYFSSLILGSPVPLPKPFMTLFMSVWSCGPAVIPIFLLPSLRRIFPGATSLMKIFGFAGFLCAAAYVYMLIWLQNMNNFLLALSPSFMISGGLTGMSSGILISLLFRNVRTMK